MSKIFRYKNQALVFLALFSLFSCSRQNVELTSCLSSLPLSNLAFLKNKLSRQDLDAFAASKSSAGWQLLSLTNRALLAVHDQDSLQIQVYASSKHKDEALMVRLSDGTAEHLAALMYMGDYKEWIIAKNPFYIPPLKDFVSDKAVIPAGMERDTTLYTYVLKPDTIQVHVHEYRLQTTLEALLEVQERETPRVNKKNYVTSYYELVWNGRSFKGEYKRWRPYIRVLNIRAAIVEPDPELGVKEEGPGPLYWACPRSVALSVSSTLNGAPAYAKENLLDEDVKTAWVEGAKGPGRDEHIGFQLMSDKVGKSFLVVNGYAKSPEAWQSNNRVNTLLVYIHDTLHARIILNDTDRLQRFCLFPQWLKSSPLKTGDWIRFYIEDIYKGSSYDDTAISLLMPEGDCN